VSSAPPAKAPQYRVRTTISTITIVVGILIVAMWATVGVSLVTSRQAALDAPGSQGRNLSIAFREEVAFILRGLDGEMNVLAELMRYKRGNLTFTPGVGKTRRLLADRHNSASSVPKERSNRRRLSLIPARPTFPTAIIFVSISTENLVAYSSVNRSPQEVRQASPLCRFHAVSMPRTVPSSASWSS
jgi:hypothetical protein